MNLLRHIVTTGTCIFFFALAMTACSGREAHEVLTTTTILADITRNVTGERLTVGSLLPAGIDPHSYQPVPQDAAQISDSRALVFHGGEYERFLDGLLENAGEPDRMIEASKDVQFRSGTDGVDPHVWLDPIQVIAFVENIREGLTELDPDGAEIYQANASAYTNQLAELDAWINGQIAQIQPQHRVLVTNHESLGYFAERYGFTVVGTVLPGSSSDSAASAQQMADLIEQIRLHEVPAIFLDASDNPDLAKQIAAETGVKVIRDLHLESLTEGDPAPTYIDMMRDNVTKIVQALQ